MTFFFDGLQLQIIKLYLANEQNIKLHLVFPKDPR